MTAPSASQEPPATGQPLRLDVFADIACPWCFLGQRNLARALEGFAHPVLLRHRAFQLNPGASAAGEPAPAYLARKFGSAARVEAAHARLAQMGAPVGLRFDWARQLVTNTRLAHRVVALAAEQGAEQPALEALFRAQFEDGANVGDPDAALAALERHGVKLDLAALRASLHDGGGEASVDRDLAEARELGVDGVPLFVAELRLAVSGAQPPEVLRSFLDEAVRSAAAPA